MKSKSAILPEPLHQTYAPTYATASNTTTTTHGHRRAPLGFLGAASSVTGRRPLPPGWNYAWILAAGAGLVAP